MDHKTGKKAMTKQSKFKRQEEHNTNIPKLSFKKQWLTHQLNKYSMVEGRIKQFQGYVDQRDDRDKDENQKTQHVKQQVKARTVGSYLVPQKEDNPSE
eukprot:12361740-Heterocapsa_arctica.AAC.1